MNRGDVCLDFIVVMLFSFLSFMFLIINQSVIKSFIEETFRKRLVMLSPPGATFRTQKKKNVNKRKLSLCLN